MDESSESGDNRAPASNPSQFLIDGHNDVSLRFRDGKRKIGNNLYLINNAGLRGLQVWSEIRGFPKILSYASTVSLKDKSIKINYLYLKTRVRQ